MIPSTLYVLISMALKKISWSLEKTAMENLGRGGGVEGWYLIIMKYILLSNYCTVLCYTIIYIITYPILLCSTNIKWHQVKQAPQTRRKNCKSVPFLVKLPLNLISAVFILEIDYRLNLPPVRSCIRHIWCRTLAPRRRLQWSGSRPRRTCTLLPAMSPFLLTESLASTQNEPAPSGILRERWHRPSRRSTGTWLILQGGGYIVALSGRGTTPAQCTMSTLACSINRGSTPRVIAFPID